MLAAFIDKGTLSYGAVRPANGLDAAAFGALREGVPLRRYWWGSVLLGALTTSTAERIYVALTWWPVRSLWF